MGALPNVVQEVKKEEQYKLKMHEKLTFGIGDFGANFSWTFIASFVTIYLTDTVGMAAGIIGTIILIARLFDGLTDIYMGNIIDNTKSKMGKAKPWVFWTAPPLALLTFLIFNVPSFLGETGQIVYVFVLYMLISAVFYTANNVAYSSLTSFMTKDPAERVSLGSIRFMFAISAVLLISSFTIVLVNQFGGGQRGWTFTALIAAVLCALSLMTTGWFVKERNVAERVDEGQKTPFIPTIKELIKNKYFILAIILYLLLYIRSTSSAVQIYYATYILDNPNLMGPLSFASMLPPIIGLIFAPAIVKRFGLRTTLVGGLIISLIGFAICLVNSENVTWLLIGLIIKAIGGAPLTAGASAVVADVGDLVYWKSGVPVQGSVFSITSAGMKIGQGFASAMVGWVLALGSYIPNAVNQPDSSILAMKALFLYIPLVITLLTVVVVALFKHEKSMPQIRMEIEAKRIGEKRDKSIDLK